MTKTSLPQDLLLLTLRPDGTKIKAQELPPALAGAALVELLLQDRVRIDDGRATVVNSAPVGDAAADRLLAWLCQHPNTKLAKAVEKNQRHLANEVAAGLAAAGLVKVDTKKALGLFPQTVYPGANTQELRATLDSILQGVTPDARSAALLCLLQAHGSLRQVFPQHDRKHLKARVKSLATDDAISAAVRKVIQDAQVAAAAAATVAASAAAASS